MRPYKKRSFCMDLQRKDYPLDDENDDDEKQRDVLSPNEENEKEKDKEKDGLPRGRKRWKRKISRKQFRHHDIKLFTPGEYKTSTLLKQKEPNHPEVAKSEAIQKESITDSIVTSLTGQKQQALGELNAQKRLKVDEVDDGKTINILEENNNTNTAENHNSIGKHHLPAIITENPVTTKRNIENNWPKVPFNGLYQTHSKPVSDYRTVQCRPAPIAVSVLESIPKLPQSPKEKIISPGVSSPGIQNIPPPSYNVDNFYKNSSHNNQLEEQMEVENAVNDQPEDLSIQTPVDLSKKNVVEEKQNGNQIERKKTYEDAFTSRTVGTNKGHIPEERYVRPNSPNHTRKSASPEVITSTSSVISPHAPSKQWSISNPIIRYTHHIMSIFNEIRPFLKKPFTAELLNQIEYVYRELRKIKEDDNIPHKLKMEAQNLCAEVENFLPKNPSLQHSKEVGPWTNLQADKMNRSSHLETQPKIRPKVLPNVYSGDPIRGKEYPSFYSQTAPDWFDQSKDPDIDRTYHMNLGRPRSKSHRNDKEPPRVIRRSMSNPQATDRRGELGMVNPLNGSRWVPLPPCTPRTSLSSGRNKLDLSPSAYSELFYKNLQRHIANGHPLPVSVHPIFTPTHISRDRIQQIPSPQEIRRYPSRPKTPPTVRNCNEKEEISSTSDDAFKITSPLSLNSKQKPLEKSTLPAVIVGDNSMEITKETNEPPTLEDIVVRIPGSKNSPGQKHMTEVLEKDQDENNMEFLVWLEKLKNNEKLKKEFLNQMGIHKETKSDQLKEDTIEIVDSDDEKSQSHRINQKTSEESVKRRPEDSPLQKPLLAPIPLATPRRTEQNKSNPSTSPTSKTKIPVSGQIMTELRQLSTTDKPITPILDSLVKRRPISFPDAQSTSTSGRYLPTVRNKEKIAYSPQIEPISPAGSETGFVFPEVSRAKSDKPVNLFGKLPNQKTANTYSQFPNGMGAKGPTERRKSTDRPQAPCSPRVAPQGKLCYIRDNHMFIRYFDDTQVELFIRNLSIQDDELLKTTGINPDNFSSYNASKRRHSVDQYMSGTEVINLPRDVEFSRKEDLREVEEFVKERTLVEKFVPKDFADFYRYVTGFQIIKDKPPVSLQTFLAMYNTNRTTELLRKYLQRIDVDTPVSGVK